MKITKNLVCLLLIVLSCLSVISTQAVLAQGRPDLVWMRGGPTGEVLSMSYSPDGKHLAAGSRDGFIRIWRVADCVLERTFVVSGQAKYVAFLPDGDRLISVTSEGMVAVYRLSDGERGLNWSLNKTFSSGAVSSDGSLFGIGFTDGSVQVWHTTDASSVISFQAHTTGYQVYSLSFSTDNQRLVTTAAVEASEDTVRVWRVSDAAIISSATPVRGLYMQPRARFLPGGYEILTYCNIWGGSSVFHVVDSTTGQATRTFSMGQSCSSFHTFDMSPDGQFAIVGSTDIYYNGPNSHIDAQATDIVRLADGVKVHTGGGYKGVFSSAGEYALCSSGGQPSSSNCTIQFGRTSDWGWNQQLIYRGAAIQDIGINNSGDIVSSSYLEPIRIQQQSGGSISSESPFQWKNSLVSGDGSTVLLRYDNALSACRTSDWSLISDFGTHAANAVCLSQDGSLAAFMESTIKIVRVADKHEVADIHIGTSTSWSQMKFTHDGTRLASGTYPGTTSLYRVDTGELVRTFSMYGGGALAFSSDDRLLAIYSSGVVQLFQVSNGNMLHQLDLPWGGDSYEIACMSFSPDGQVLAIGDKKARLSLWQVEEGDMLASYNLETGKIGGGVTALTYSPDGKFIYYGRADGVVAQMLNPCRSLVIPNRGGNTGNVSVKIVTPSTFELTGDVQVKLTAPGMPDIVATEVNIINAHLATGKFDLRSAAVGKRDVTISVDGSPSLTFPQGFAVEKGVEVGLSPQIVPSVLGPDVLRGGSWRKYYSVLSNYSNIDMDGVSAFLTFPSWLRYQQSGVNAYSAEEENTLIRLPAKTIPAYGAQMEAVSIKSDSFSDAHKDFTMSLTVPSDEESVRDTLKKWHITVNKKACCDGNNDVSVEKYNEINKTKEGCTSVGGLSKPIVDFLINMTNKDRFGGGFEITGGSESGGGHKPGQNSHSAGCKVDIRPSPELDEWIRKGRDENDPDGYRGKDKYWTDRDSECIHYNWESDPPHWDVEFGACGGFCGGGFSGSSSGGCGSASGGKTSNVIWANDPNDITGSNGFGADRWVGIKQPLNYVIQFENKSDATAPAADVYVTGHLDPTSLDLTTVNLGDITFGDKTISPTLESSPPVGTHQFNAQVDLRPANNLIVKINTNLDMLTGELKWTLNSIDPDTGLPPEDALAGFLPPGGEGSMMFSVMPKQDVATGTIVRTKASIVFDYNAPMDTPEWFNTIDAILPTSSVHHLSGRTESTNIQVDWSGSDGESGLRGYSIYVSDNSGPFQPWLSMTSDTQGTFTGENGHTYAFYSQATDNAYNIETAHSTADAVTTVVANPIPSIASLSPNSIAVGSSEFTLIISGKDFVDGCRINWNGADRPTTFVSDTQVTAQIPATEVKSTGSAIVAVTNPIPAGGISNTLVFLVGAPKLIGRVALVKTSAGIKATVTVTNSGTASASNVKITTATLGTSASGGLPINLGNIAVGESKSTVLTFSVAAGSSTFKLNGTYQGGSFASSLRVNVP